ncbi:major capsid protein [Acinetobacter junii]|uniref:major capsid protein n=1 Tax=Acinetobacter junii TaxID=40215 RepID=UPI00403D7994
MIENQNALVVQEKRGVLTLRNVSTYGLGAVASTVLISNANAAIDVSAPIAALTTDGTTAITAVGTALLALAGIAVVFKWVKAAFFS